MNDLYYLSHGGPGSGRYPLGSGDRPYQKFEGSRRQSGISGYIQSRRIKKAEDEIMKRRQEEAKKELQEKEKREKFEKNKETLLRSGRASDILKYKGLYTNRELSDVIQRLEYEQKLSNYSQSEIQSTMSKIDKMMKNLNTINNWGSIATDTYNLMASVYNATPEGKKKPLTSIKKQGDQKKK